MAALAFPADGVKSRRRSGSATSRGYAPVNASRNERSLRVVGGAAKPVRGDDPTATIHLLRPQPQSVGARSRALVAQLPRRAQSYAPITPLRRIEAVEPVQIIAMPPRPEDPSIAQEAEIARRLAARRRARIARMRRRRLVSLSTAVATVGALVGLWLGAGAVSTLHSSSLRVLPGTVATTGGYLYTVQSGDTIWSVASRIVTSGDPRPIVDRLEAEVGSTNLVPGTKLLVP